MKKRTRKNKFKFNYLCFGMIILIGLFLIAPNFVKAIGFEKTLKELVAEKISEKIDLNKWLGWADQEPRGIFEEMSLSSLDSNLLPSANNTYDLGAYGNAWKDIYASGSLYVGAGSGLTTITGGTATSSIAHGLTVGSNALVVQETSKKIGVNTNSPLTNFHLYGSYPFFMVEDSSTPSFMAMRGDARWFFDSNSTFKISSQSYANRGTASGETDRLTISGATGDITFGGRLLAGINNNYDLGAYGTAWQDIFASGSWYGNLKAGTNNVFDLGTYGNAWKDIYASGTVYASSTDISNSATAGYKIGGSIVLRNPFTNTLLVGQGAGANLNSDGTDNIFIGYQSGFSTTSTDYNTGIGSLSLFSNTSGFDNTAIGRRALYSNTLGTDNTGVGNYSLNWNTTGSYNSAIGSLAGVSNTTGDYNTAVGSIALNSNTTGSNNVAIGSSALYLNVSATNTVAIGYQAGMGGVGSYNQNGVYLGYNAGVTLTTGNNNIFIGYQAGDAIETGANNLIIGYNVDATSTVTSNFLNLGGALYGWLGTGGAIYPSAHNSRDFGTYDNVWKDIYSSGTLYGNKIALSAGTAAAPSYTFAGDTATGIFSSAANQIGFSFNGVQKAYFDTNGFLQIVPIQNSTFDKSVSAFASSTTSQGTTTSTIFSLVLTTTSTVYYDFYVLGHQQNGSGTGRYRILGTAKRYDGVSYLDSTTKSMVESSNSLGWDTAATFVGDTLNFNVSGDADENIIWRISGKYDWLEY